MKLKDVLAVARFERPSVEAILAERERYGDEPVAVDVINRDIDKAEEWLAKATETINATFRFLGLDEAAAASVRYREEEDLGYGCGNPGSSPFNTVYPDGPTVHVVLSKRTSVYIPHLLGAAFSRDVIFESFHPATDSGCLLICYLPKHKMYVAFRDE